MIHWSLTLTGNQIAVMKALKDRKYGVKRSDEETRAQLEITHWITGVRGLLKEGLIECFAPPEGKDKYDYSKRGQFLTERGRFILRMIEEDIEKFLSPPKPESLHPTEKKRGAA